MVVGVHPATIELGGRFALTRCLGAGAFGTVFEAHDTGADRRIAIKQLRVFDGDALYRFKQEFRSAADIVHPNLVGLRELFSEDGQWYMTMEFIDGVDFRVWIRGDAPPAHDDDEATHRWRAGDPDHAPIRRAGAAFDERRLREALPQLVDAVHTLHQHNILHRDLKPSNVMIDGDNRLRVLDYGLAAPIGPEGLHASTDDLVVGTPAYMSPEQSQGLALATATDWYAVGVMMFEALTGRLPFEGNARDVLWHKATEDGPDPRMYDRELPDDLAGLCRGLLARDPDRRPAHAEIAAVVENKPCAKRAQPLGDVFVAREAELAALQRAADGARDGCVIVHVHGASGVGKSALVRRFLGELAAGTLALSGRCYERESVPFKALDSVIDALTDHLASLSHAAAERLVPKHAAALVRVFPVLSRIDAFARARMHQRITDANEVRRYAALALRQLLGELAQARTLIVSIDDLQWGDVDSAMFFREVVALPDPPPMLLVLAYRSEDAAADMIAAMRTHRGASIVDVALQPLALAEAQQLASLLAGERAVDVQRIATESGGLPFFVHELARSASVPLGTLSLADALARRLDELPAPARALLDVVAAASGPINLRVARGAAGTGLDEMIALRAARLVRSRGDGDEDLVECFHDRVRETALEHLHDPAGVHRRLALALEAEPGCDPEALAHHFQAAGDDARTLEYARRAAELASEKLAFGRAAALYELALQLAPADSQQPLVVRYAEALASAGRGVEAGRAFRRAADGQTGDDSVRLRTRAAQQFLRSGHVDDGVHELRPALAQLSLALPKSPASALVTLLGRRALLKVRGLEFRSRDEGDVPPADLHRIDLCWSVGNGLGGIDMIRAATFQSQHLLLALSAGEPYRVSRAIAWESIVRSMEGGAASWQRAADLGATAKAIAERIDHPHARAWASATDAILAWCQGKWRDAEACSVDTIARFREAQSDVAWEVGSMYAWWLLPAQYFGGKLVELAAQAPARVDEVEAIGDLYTATSMRTYVLPLVHLIAGDPDRAEAETRGAIERWSRSGWHLQHWCDLKTRAEIALYRGDGAAVVRAWDDEWPEVKKSLLLRMRNVAVQTRYSLGRGLVAAAARTRDNAGLLRRAGKLAGELAAMETGWATQFSRTLDAGIAMRSGKRDAALEALADASRGFEALDMALHGAAIDLIRGAVLGDRTLAAFAEQWLRSHDVADPAALAASLVPGFAPD
jgi:hypothetical protein